MKGEYLNILFELNAKHALYSDSGKWYHNLKKFPGVLFDKNGYVVFASNEEYYSEPLIQIKKDLNVPGGIKNLKKYRFFSPKEIKLIKGVKLSELEQYSDFEEANRISREVEIIVRDKNLVNKLKDLYENKCQICGIKLKISVNKVYSEVHHIIPLGQPHNGPDKLQNMLCVCPNHHVQLDYFSIPIEMNSLKQLKHKISEDSIHYHNSRVRNL